MTEYSTIRGIPYKLTIIDEKLHYIIRGEDFERLVAISNTTDPKLPEVKKRSYSYDHV